MSLVSEASCSCRLDLYKTSPSVTTMTFQSFSTSMESTVFVRSKDFRAACDSLIQHASEEKVP